MITQEKLQGLMKRIKELEEIVSASEPKLTQEIPVGYTAARWQLALQSFNERLPALKNLFRNKTKNLDAEDGEFEIEFGPEWDLKCAQMELKELLNNL